LLLHISTPSQPAY